MARRKNSPGGMLPETIRTAYLGMFADMTAEQQDGVIAALQTIRTIKSRPSDRQGILDGHADRVPEKFGDGLQIETTNGGSN